MSEARVQEARLTDAQRPKRGRGCAGLRSAACSKLRTAVQALGMARTLWMHPFVQGTAVPHESRQLAAAACLQAACAPFSTRQAARKGARPSLPGLSAERDEPPPRLEGPRAPASRTAASAAWGALGGHRATRSRVPTPCGRLATAASASGKVGAGFPGGARSRRQGSVQRAVPRLCSSPAPTRTLYPLGLAHLLDGLLSDLPFASRPRRREGHGHGGGADSARDHWGLFSGCAPRPEVPILRSAGAGVRGARCRGLARLPIANARSRPPRPRALFDCLPGPDPVRSPPTPGLRSASSRLPLRRPLCWVSVVRSARPAPPRRAAPHVPLTPDAADASSVARAGGALKVSVRF